MALSKAGISACVLVSSLCAAPGPAAVAFTVASVKKADVMKFVGVSLSPSIDPGNLRCVCSLQTLVRTAYQVKRDQIVFPARLRESDVYEVLAKFDESSRAELPQMLRQLLAERFGMTTHREQRVTPIYAVVVDKGGLKLKRSPLPATPEESIRNPPRSHAGVVIGGRSDRLKVNGSGTLDEIAGMLKLDRPVVNMTGITGRFEYAIDALVPPRGEPLILASGRVIPVTGDEPMPGDPESIFKVIRTLGLVLEPRKQTTEYLVVDRILTTPTAN